MAKTNKTVVKKIPALSKNVSSNALKTKTKIASMQEKIQVLNNDINATEDENINKMIKVSEEIAEYHHWHEAQEPVVSVKSLTWHTEMPSEQLRLRQEILDTFCDKDPV